MSTDIRPEISRKRKYWISKHRFYELKHFCLQYPEWKEEIKLIPIEPSISPSYEKLGKSSRTSDPTYEAVLRREALADKIKMVEDAAKVCPEYLEPYLLKAVTRGMSYETLLVRYKVPFCKDMYYTAFRKFFWVLSKMRK